MLVQVENIKTEKKWTVTVQAETAAEAARKVREMYPKQKLRVVVK